MSVPGRLVLPHPPIEPPESGMLDVGDGQSIDREATDRFVGR